MVMEFITWEICSLSYTELDFSPATRDGRQLNEPPSIPNIIYDRSFYASGLR